MIACDRARLVTEFGFKAHWPMCLAYEQSASSNAGVLETQHD
jgi:hypothetical protein